MADILDVAKKAGVSKSTVSRVLNHGYVSDQTREKVERVMEELQYTPSSFAQNIRTHRTREVAMMIPDPTNTFYMEVFRAVEDVMLKNDYMVILCDSKQKTENELKYAEKLRQRNTDGLLYFAQQRVRENEDFFRKFSVATPTVFMDYAFSDIADISCVAMEGSRISTEAVHYLYRTGRKRIAYINLPKTNNVTLLRCEGYRKGLEECGLPILPDLVFQPAEDNTRTLFEVGYHAAEELLARQPQIDAIMTATDHLAVGVIKFLRKKNLRIPEDVSVIGVDDIDLCEVVRPTLSTIRQPIREIGHTAANMLLKIIRGEEERGRKVIYEGKLILRESTIPEGSV